MRWAACAMSIGWLAMMGCGGATEPAEVTMDMMAARASIDQVGKIVAAMSAMTGGDAASDVTSLMAAHQELVTLPPAEEPPAGVVAVFPDLGSAAPPATGSAVCTADSCTFTAYGYTVGYDEFRIDGTVTHSSDLLAFQISYQHSFKVHVDQMVWTLDGSISTASGLDGSVRFRATGSGFSSGAMWDATVPYRAITLDAQGCPTGGSLQVTTSYVIPSRPPGEYAGPPGFVFQASTAFGPGCH